MKRTLGTFIMIQGLMLGFTQDTSTIKCLKTEKMSIQLPTRNIMQYFDSY